MTLTGDFTYFLLILARMSGCVFFNQIFGRGNLPSIFKISLSLFFTVTAYGMLPPQADIVVSTNIEYMFLIIKELFIGYIIGYIISSFFSIVVIGGEVMDMQMGMSMSKIYDPSSNVSSGITGSFLNIILIFLFFSANGHISLIKIFMTSCKLIEIGNFSIPQDLFRNMVEMFSQILILSLKLAMPLMAVEIILESGIGVLMKAIPQIQVFSVNVQLKIIVGLLLILMLVPTFSTFIDKILTLMFEQVRNSLSSLIT
ncbi:flagellar biosynthetic protein FliR [Sedimentibacter sp. B4]|uniref:flagellar biosynthetic protein FliR n=1 Tax=Sedimentibacter sp. B4 TaxID=304766 RepID=UPI0002F06116|nr:flagellar biosynthetic protein FliR [Sedimentibacter sp. B4]